MQKTLVSYDILLRFSNDDDMDDARAKASQSIIHFTLESTPLHYYSSIENKNYTGNKSVSSIHCHTYITQLHILGKLINMVEKDQHPHHRLRTRSATRNKSNVSPSNDCYRQPTQQRTDGRGKALQRRTAESTRSTVTNNPQPSRIYHARYSSRNHSFRQRRIQRGP